MSDGSGSGIYFIVGALVAAVVAMFVLLSVPHLFFGDDSDTMRVETPHAALERHHPPVVRVKYQSRTCSPVQNKTPGCLAA